MCLLSISKEYHIRMETIVQGKKLILTFLNLGEDFLFPQRTTIYAKSPLDFKEQRKYFERRIGMCVN